MLGCAYIVCRLLGLQGRGRRVEFDIVRAAKGLQEGSAAGGLLGPQHLL